MPDTRYRIRIVPATKGTAWKVVSPEGKTVSVGTDPADAVDRMNSAEFLKAFVIPAWYSPLAESWGIL